MVLNFLRENKGKSLLTMQSPAAAWNSTPRSGDRSYGALVLVTHFAAYVQSFFPNLFTFDQWRFLFELAALAIAVASMIGVVLSCWYLLLKIDLPLIPFKDPLNRSFITDEIINWCCLPNLLTYCLYSLPNGSGRACEKCLHGFKKTGQSPILLLHKRPKWLVNNVAEFHP